MARYPLQHVVGVDTHHANAFAQARSCRAVWDADNASFTDCALPYVPLVPLAIISILTIAALLSRVALVKRWRPNWTKPLILQHSTNQATNRILHPSIFWPSALFLLGISATVLQIWKLVSLPQLRLHATFHLISWLLLTLNLAITRPRSSPVSYLIFYFPALVAELSPVRSWAFQDAFQLSLNCATGLFIVVSICIVFYMPYTLVSPNEGPIGRVGAKPAHTDRSPEDGIRLYQWLSLTWVWPLLVIGNARQLEKDDIWALPYASQTHQLALRFRTITGSTVFRRLLKTNAADCCILLTISLASQICEFSKPLLFHRLLMVMENPNLGKKPAILYAIMLFLRTILATQLAMMGMWYGRRCYERTRGELSMLIYQKALSRKMIAGNKDQNPAPPSNGHQNGNNVSNGTSSSTTATKDNPKPNGHSQDDSSKAGLIGPKKMTEVKDSSNRVTFALLKQLFRGSNEPVTKSTAAATTGQVLNLLRADTSEIAMRFRETRALVRAPIGLLASIWLIWSLLGPSCFFAIIVILLSQGLNAIVAKLLIRQRRYEKKSKDSRIQKCAEYLDIIRHLRWYGWQDIWLAKVMEARQHELKMRVMRSCLAIVAYTITVCGGQLFPIAAFISYTAIAGHKLRIDLIFPALQLFQIFQARLREIPNLIITLLNAQVAMERVEKFNREPELEQINQNSVDPSDSTSLVLENCSFAWPGQTEPVLRNVDVVVQLGLTLVYGNIGSGKSALLQALVGEMEKLHGRFEVPDQAVAYCLQTPWLQSISIRDNILFSTPYEEERYQLVLDACALRPDLAIFPDGDLSLIGENGIGLSGGQRARVSLARALYSRSKILLLDDPLSALDHPTAENIVQSCFAPQSNLAKGRTIILVTHRTGLVRHLATQFIEITDGRVSVLTHDPFPDDDPTQQNESSNSKSVDTQPSPTPEKKAQATKVPRDFIKEEQREHGSIKLNVFLTFSNAARAWWIFLFGMLALVRVSAIAEQWMFKAWGEGYGEVTTTSSIVYQPEFQSKRKEGMVKLYFSLDPAAYLPSPNDDLRPWIIVLLAVSIGRCIALCLYAISQYTAIYATTSVFFEQALKRVTNATFQFYDNTPAGRILNRVTSDIDILDSALDSFGGTLSSIGIFVSALIVIASISPIFFLFVGTLMAIFVLIFRKFLPTSRSLKRLEATALSPLYTIFGELLQNNSAGLTTVRAFRAQPHFYNRVVSIIDQFQAYNHFYFSVQNWLMWRYENISNLSSFLLTMIALATDLSPGMMAFLLLTAGNFVNATHLVCSRFGSMQTEFVAVERIAELLETEQEPKGDYNPPASWPRIGSNVTLKNVTIKYSSDLEPALHNISLSIPGGRITAIIGRTGSGKSTLAAALLNIVTPEPGGTITIDDASLTDMNVETLRRRVTFVPQDPVLFPGTIRQNLDPLETYSDDECGAILDRVGSCIMSSAASAAVASQNWTLDTVVETGGQNFSQGQRQVIGLARAILRRSPVVVMDEAMASIDDETALRLRKVLREELKGATVIMVAHRVDVEGVQGADYEVVLEEGRVVREGKVGGEGNA